MNAKPIPHRTSPIHRGFTLVEILTVIVIIGILAGIAIPAINRARITAIQAAQKLELNSIATAIERYNDKYGDYPPDGSVERNLKSHMRKLFPRMAEPDLTLLGLLTDDSTNNTMVGGFSGAAMDRAEALVFFLGGFSDSLQNPITGPGGPLALIPGGTAGADLSQYQYNADRINRLFEFDPARLTITGAGTRLVSTDESDLGNTGVGFGGPMDLLPTYLARDGGLAPIVYFESRTYGVIGNETTGSGTRSVYNGYIASQIGGIRPYKTSFGAAGPSGTTYADEAEAFDAIKFHNPDTFQVISPGMDDFFGAIVSIDPDDRGAAPVHFVTQTGQPATPDATAASFDDLEFVDSALGGKGYQDSQWEPDDIDNPGTNGNLDNVTNFGEAAILENSLE